MQKIFENLYFFSKLAFSLILLFCLISILIIFYFNYQNQSETSQKTESSKKFLEESIVKNSNLIDKVAEKIKSNQTDLQEIKKIIKSISLKNNNNDLEILKKDIQLLNTNFIQLSKELKELKQQDLKLSKEDNIDLIRKSINDIVDLILIKYENNIKFEKEIEYLKNNTDSKIDPLFEKIILLSNKPFKGYSYLKTTFDEEVNIYIKKNIKVSTYPLLGDIILPYLKISPSTENTIDSDVIIKIKKVMLNIENKNIEKVFEELKNIEDYKNNFKLTLVEINKYLNFKKAINKIL